MISKFRFRRGIASFLALNIAMLIIVVMALTTMMDIRRERASFQEELGLRGQALVDTLSKVVTGPLAAEDSAALHDIADVVRSQPDVSYVEVFTNDGTPLVISGTGNDEISSSDEFGMSALDSRETVRRLEGGLMEFAAPLELDREVIGGVRFGFALDGVEARNRSIIIQRAWQTAVLVVVGLVVSYLMAQYFVIPLKRLAGTAAKLGEGEVDDTGGQMRNDEIGEVSRALSQLAGKLQEREREREDESQAELTRELKSLKGRLKSEVSNRKRTEQALDEANGNLEHVKIEHAEELKAANERLQYEAAERMRVQEKLQQYQDMESVGDFARAMAHDINNLLTPIMGHTKIVSRRLPEDDRLQNNLEEIGKAARQLGDVLRRFQELYKSQAAKQKSRESTSSTQTEGGHNDLPSGTGVILLVDDEDSVRSLSATLLREQGYAVLEAASGPEALKLVQVYTGTRIHLLMTDVLMPGMDGKELAKQLKVVHPETRVLYTSGYNDESLMSHGVLESEDVFVQKPITPEALAAKIQEAFTPRRLDSEDAAGDEAKLSSA